MFARPSIEQLAVPLVVLVFAVLILLGTAPPSSGAAHPRSYVVRPGDTLWGIALRIRPGQDPRQEVYAIEQANHLPGGMLQAGQVVTIP